MKTWEIKTSSKIDPENLKFFVFFFLKRLLKWQLNCSSTHSPVNFKTLVFWKWSTLWQCILFSPALMVWLVNHSTFLLVTKKMFKPFHGDVGPRIWLKRQLWLNTPMLHRQRHACISCRPRFRHTISSLRPFRRMCRCIFRAGRFQSSSPFYGGRHHNGYHIYQRFQPSSYAWPKMKTIVIRNSNSSDLLSKVAIQSHRMTYHFVVVWRLTELQRQKKIRTISLIYLSKYKFQENTNRIHCCCVYNLEECIAQTFVNISLIPKFLLDILVLLNAHKAKLHSNCKFSSISSSFPIKIN